MNCISFTVQMEQGHARWLSYLHVINILFCFYCACILTGSFLLTKLFFFIEDIYKYVLLMYTTCCVFNSLQTLGIEALEMMATRALVGQRRLDPVIPSRPNTS